MREPTKGVLAMSNPYYIPKYRYYELKYRCLQYNDWLERYNDLTGYLFAHDTSKIKVDGGEQEDRTYKAVVERMAVRHDMDILKQATLALPMSLQQPIFEAVTEGKGWQVIWMKYELICTRDEYYNAYHLFFYTYDKLLRN